MVPRFAALLLLGATSAQQVPEGAEPNASVATATVLPIGREALGGLANAADSDWWRVVLVATRDLRLETGPGVTTEIGDTRLVLLDGSGSPLAANDDGVGCGRYSRLHVRALPAGTYHVAVEAGAFAATSGSYVLDVRASVPTTFAVPPIVAEGPENNDPRSGGTATFVTLPVRGNGVLASVGAAGDWDFWRFQLANETFVRANLAATATHPLTPRADDPVLYLFDGSTPPNLLAGPFHARDYGVWDTPLDVRLPAGTYQVAIRGWAGSVGGRYYLDLHAGPAAGVTVHAGGCGGRVASVATTLVGPGAPLRVERPAIGTTYAVRGSNLDAGGIALHVIGFAATFLDLTSNGAPGCVLEVVFVDTPVQIADGAGNTTFVLPIPETLSLAGATIESQIAVYDQSNALGATISNRVSAIVGP